MFGSFKQRSTQVELMDDQTTDYPNFRDCLRGLETVNKLTLAYRPTAHWLRKMTKKANHLLRISILDVGSGGGDMLRFISRWSHQHHLAVELRGVDLNPWSRQYAEHKTPSTMGISFETSDLFNIDHAQQTDFILSSLFTHHLNDEQLVSFLQWMELHAKKGWFINDLHRHAIAYFSFKYISRMLGFHYMIQHDGPISVARAFKKQDWREFLTKAHIPLDQVTIRWFFPFRYCVTRFKL